MILRHPRPHLYQQGGTGDEEPHRIGAGTAARSLWMGTFHSVFARMLRAEATKIGYTSNFTIYDSDDSKNLLKNIIKEMGLNDKQYKANSVHYRSSLAKNNLINHQEYSQHPELTGEDEAYGRPKISDIYKEYAKRCFVPVPWISMICC